MSQDKELEGDVLDFTPIVNETDMSVLEIHLAIAYEKGIMPDENKALQLLKISAERENRDAQYRLALKLEGKEWIEEWRDSAYWMEKSARNGNVTAMYEMRRYAKDELEKRMWLLASAERGHVEGMYHLACSYKNKKEPEVKDRQFAFKWFSSYVDKCPKDKVYAYAYHNLGYYYNNGLGTEKNQEKGFQMYSKAFVLLQTGHKYSHSEKVDAERNYMAEINLVLGNMYFYGRGIPIIQMNDVLAYKHYLYAIENEDITGEPHYQLYQLHQKNSITKEEFDMLNIKPYPVFPLIQTSADYKYPEALYQLALKHYDELMKITEYNKVKEKDELIETIESLLIPAIEKDHVDSIVLLSILYWPITKIKDRSIVYRNCYDLWLKAKKLTADNERADINYYLGVMYKTGVGISTNHESAIKHFKIFVEKYDPEKPIKLPINGFPAEKNILEHFDYSTDVIKNVCEGSLFEHISPQIIVNLETLCEYNNLDAQYKLSWMHWNGHGTKQDKEKALELYCDVLLKDKDNILKDIRQEFKAYENEILVHKLTQVGEPTEAVEGLKKSLDTSQKMLADLQSQMNALMETVSKIKDKQGEKEIIVID